MAGRNPPPSEWDSWDQRHSETRVAHRERGPDGQARERERERERERRAAEAENYKKSLDARTAMEHRDRNRGIYTSF
jgi:hypothetical protein